ncbi:MAG: RHS repeat-associated core domain-containing protein, partial [Bacteroidales bacterium]|nr:RHS repeat-associated core domain-containing protein [Bacteroidales bacterium]
HTKAFAQDYRYGFEPATGNLSWRTDAVRGLSESFTYDDDDNGLHSRLTGWSINGQNLAELQYQANGNISRKTDVSAAHNSYHYQHPQGKPHAVTSVSQPTPAFVSAAPEQSISYTPFNKVSFISNTYPNGRNHEFHITYGPDNQRKFSLLAEDQGVGMPLLTETYYLGQYETKRNLPSTEQKIHYLSSPTGLFGILVQNGSSEQLYYVLKDHLGSITGVADASGNILEDLSYDPWGRRRNAYDWSDYNVGFTRFDRGYTGHEHLVQFGLINMNGRVYDPFLARFLSPDPQLQSPDYSQNYNRYSYAWNNPLKYTDPSGEFVHLVIGAIVGAYINVFMNKDKIDNPWQMFGYFGVGALGGALAAGVGSGVSAALAGNAAAGGGFMAGFMGTARITSTGFIAGSISGAAAGFTNGLVSGTGNQLIEGERLGDAFVKGGLGQAWRQGIGGAVIGGAIGGIHATNNNRNFWTGVQKTYKIPDSPLLASLDNGVSISQDGFTVKNNSGETIYYKPEATDPLRGIKGAYPIRDGNGIRHAVDGLTAPGKPGQVFKITDPFNTASISVNYSSVSIDKPYVFGELSLNRVMGGGWLTTPPDKGWYQIFKMAGYEFK